MLITASTDGRFAHAAFLEVLNVIEADVNNHQLLIPFARTKIDADNIITDIITGTALKQVIERFTQSINETLGTALI